jgi:hypothetical protein
MRLAPNGVSGSQLEADDQAAPEVNGGAVVSRNGLRSASFLSASPTLRNLKSGMRFSIVCPSLSGRPRSSDEKENLLKQRSMT